MGAPAINFKQSPLFKWPPRLASRPRPTEPIRLSQADAGAPKPPATFWDMEFGGVPVVALVAAGLVATGIALIFAGNSWQPARSRRK